MSRLNLFPNSSNESPENQLSQIRMALLDINSWGNRQSNQLSLNFEDSVKTNLAINSSDYQGIGYSFTFKPNSSLQQVCGNIDLSASAASTLQFLLDNTVVYELRFESSLRSTYSFNFYIEANAGVSHSLVVKGTGNFIKYPGKNKVQIVTQIN